MVAIKIIEWEDKYAEQFKRLSLEWLEKYVSVEPADLEIINNPHRSILDNLLCPL
jgi:DNA polymerase III epsilon subunit-like protein